MAEWTNESTLKFLELYQAEPILWDPKNSFHKDKKKINDAWIRINEEMKLTIADLKKKKDSLMATFRMHLRKKRASIKSGASADEIYKPIWFAYDFMESFLGPVTACNQSVNTEEMVDQENRGAENEEENLEANDTLTIADEAAPTSSRATIRRRRNPPELLEAGKQMKEAFNVLNNAITKKTNEKEDDECNLYCKVLAKKLKKIPEDERMLIMYEIDGLFINRYQRNILNSAATSYSFPVVDASNRNLSTYNQFPMPYHPDSRPSSCYSSCSEPYSISSFYQEHGIGSNRNSLTVESNQGINDNKNFSTGLEDKLIE